MKSRGRVEVYGQEFCFIMPREELVVLCNLLRAGDRFPATIIFDGMELTFTLSRESTTFQANQTTGSKVDILITNADLLALANSIEAMATSEEDPDFVAHVHLDLLLTVPPTNVSDVVIQRQDKFHQ